MNSHYPIFTPEVKRVFLVVASAILRDVNRNRAPAQAEILTKEGLIHAHFGSIGSGRSKQMFESNPRRLTNLAHCIQWATKGGLQASEQDPSAVSYFGESLASALSRSLFAPSFLNISADCSNRFLDSSGFVSPMASE